MLRRFLYNFIAAAMFLWLCLGAVAAEAASTVDCHCFRDRSFSAENPAAFDPYLLATVQNRLLSHAFGVPRKEIVRSKMGGARGDALWVAHWVARAAGLSYPEVEALYLEQSSWQGVVKSLSADPEKLGGEFWILLPKGNEEQLAWAVVSSISVAFLGSPETVYPVLKREGASLKEAILASLLEGLQGSPATGFYTRARSKGHWGSQLVAPDLFLESVETFLAEKFASQ